MLTGKCVWTKSQLKLGWWIAAAAGAGKSKQIQNREIKILPVWWTMILIDCLQLAHAKTRRLWDVKRVFWTPGEPSRSFRVLYLVSYNVISGSNAAAAGKYEKYRLTFNLSFETIYPKLLISCCLGSGEVWLGSVHTWLALQHCTVLYCTVLYSMPRWREARCAARPPWPGWWRLCRLGTATLGPGTSNFI